MHDHDETQSGAPSGVQQDARAQGLSRRRLLTTGAAATGAAIAMPSLVGCGKGGSSSGGGKSGKVTIWWNSGFYPEEDQAVKDIANEWAKQSGNTIDLQFYSTTDLPTKEQSAVTSGVLPDVVEAEKGNTATYAYQGHLADVTDVVNSQDFTDGAKKGENLYNSKEGKASYYAVPIDQFTVPLFLWKDMLATIGTKASALPGDWNAFWQVFFDGQAAYQKKTGKKVYGVGWPLSTSAGDTQYDTQTALMAFGADVLDADGGLKATDPAVKANIVKAITWLTDLFKNGYTPKDVVNWKDSDNNTAFLNKTVMATPNGSLSIPGSVKDKNKKAWHNIITQGWPQKPDNSGPVPTIANLHEAVVFNKSPHIDAAKDFLSFFIKPENTLKFLKAGQGRWHPVQQELLHSDFFAKSEDPNIQASTTMLAGATEPAWTNASVAYQHAALQGLWGNTLGQVCLQGKSPQEAAEYAVQKLQQAFSDFPTT